MKKHILFFLTITILAANTFAQTSSWLWAKSAGVSTIYGANTLASDAAGNIIAAGTYSGASITLDSITLTNSGAGAIFIVKYNALGNILWARSEGHLYDKLNSITTDISGNIIIVGKFVGPSITFGSITLTNPSINTTDGYFFIVKYDDDGNVLWAKQAEGGSYNEAFSVVTDVSENIIVSGTFSGPYVVIDTTVLPTGGCSGDAFLVKYDAAGNVIWATSAGDCGSDKAISITVDGSGNIITVGTFSSSFITFGSITLTNANGANIFIVKYDVTGNVLWARSSGHNSSDEVLSVAADPFGNIIIVGCFYGPFITFGSITLSNPSGTDLFTVKYDAAGNILWAKSPVKTSCNAGANSVTADASGHIVVVGFFDCPSISFGSYTLTNAGNNRDIFIVKYDAAGNVLWTKSAGGIGTDEARAVITDGFENIILSGYFKNSALGFGSLPPINATNNFNMFIAKFGNLTTGLERIQNTPSIGIYPNPASNLITITGINEKTTLYMFDIVGKLIMKKVIENNTIINTNRFVEGIYSLLTESKTGRTVNKVVISR